jgi:hypothetical protein
MNKKRDLSNCLGRKSEMFNQRQEIRKRINEIVAVFRQKGAISPDKAMTAQELGLPSRFEEAMHRRLGRSGIFVQVDGKYYLSEELLKQVEEQWSSRGRGEGGAGLGGTRGNMITLRVSRMIMAFLFVILILVNLFVQSFELKLIISALIIAWIVITVVQL